MGKFKLFTIICSVLMLVVPFLQRHALACETVQFSNYKQVTSHIFSSPSVENAMEIVRVIASGKQRVDSTFGDMIASPKIILVSNADEAAGFGSNSTATAHSTPIGTCIVLGPEGQNIDVAAHELTHAEVVRRVSWLTHWLAIPVWFNEGVALLVDYREPFLIENIQLSNKDVETVFGM